MNHAVMLKPPEQRWECPNCDDTAVTTTAEPHTQFHVCRGRRGVWAPMVPAGTRCKVEVLDREDYVGTSCLPQTDGEGRPVMAVEVTRDEGNDVAVLVPCALIDFREAR